MFLKIMLALALLLIIFMVIVLGIKAYKIRTRINKLMILLASNPTTIFDIPAIATHLGIRDIASKWLVERLDKLAAKEYRNMEWEYATKHKTVRCP